MRRMTLTGFGTVILASQVCAILTQPFVIERISCDSKITTLQDRVESLQFLCPNLPFSEREKARHRAGVTSIMKQRRNNSQGASALSTVLSIGLVWISADASLVQC
jgi:hypothetical protein